MRAGSPVEHGQRLLRGLDGHLPLGLLGGRPQVGRGHNLGMFHQLDAHGRFLGEDVQGNTGQLPGVQRLQQGVLVHQLAAGDVDQPCAGLELVQLGRADELVGGIGQWRVQGDEVRSGQQVVQGHQLNAHLSGILR